MCVLIIFEKGIVAVEIRALFKLKKVPLSLSSSSLPGLFGIYLQISSAPLRHPPLPCQPIRPCARYSTTSEEATRVPLAMRRWSVDEEREIAAVRWECAAALAAAPPFPEVVGDRKILRFLRGHGHDVPKAAAMMLAFLQWRAANGVDAVRTAIVEGGLDHPMRFPSGEKILRCDG